MFKKLAATAVILAALVSGALAQGSAKPKSSLNSEVSQQFPDQTLGSITPLAARTTFNDFIASWQQAPLVNAQAGTSYTFLVSDYGKLVTTNNSSSISLTLPQAVGSFFPWSSFVLNLGTGSAVVTPQGGSTINGASSVTLNPSGGFAFIVSDGVNYEAITGSALTLPTCADTNGQHLNFSAGAVICGNTTGTVLSAPNTQTGSTYTVASGDYSIIANNAGGTLTLTLPTPSTNYGRNLLIKTTQNQTVVSASSNVLPLAGGAAGTAILAATAGKWAILQCCDIGITNWIIMASN